MLLSRSLRRLALTCALWVAATPAAHAAGLQIVQSDAQGITVRVEVPALEWGAAGADGRVRVSAAGLDGLGEPGRPSLPVAAGLIALPPGARATVRVLDSGVEDMRTGVKLTVGGKPGFRDDAGKLGLIPVVDRASAIADGPWPTSATELGDPFTVRRQRLVTLRVRPVRYDEASGTVWSRRSMTVRVDFVGQTPASLRAGAGAPAEDRHFDSVLEQAVLNFDAARSWGTPLQTATLPASELMRRANVSSLGAKAAAGTSAAPGFDEDNAEVRCLVDTTGVYSLTFANLSAAGFPAGITISQLSVHRHEFVAGGNPAYATIELPIEVDDRNSDGVFNNTDRIVVFVQNWGERSRASIAQRAWGDAEAVYATYLSGRPGARVPQRSGWNDQVLTPLNSYRTVQHYEKTTFYVNVFNPGLPPFTPAESDTNTDQFLWSGIGLYDRNDPSFPDLYPFEINDIDATRRLEVGVQWVGLKSTVNTGRATHIAYAEVRNAGGVWTLAIDSTQWQGRATNTARRSVPGTVVTNGKNNAIRIFGKTLTAPGNVINAGINWYEIAYARRFKAMGGLLRCNSDSVSGAFQINATQFSTRNIRVWDVTDSLAPVRLALADSLISTGAAPYTVRFQDTSPSGALRRYVAFDVPVTLPPAKFSSVTRQNLAGRGTNDALIIAPEILLPSAERLAAHRRTQGLRVLVCPLEAVNDEFNGGRKSSYAIKRLIKYSYDTWGAKFVTLMGDGSEDPQNQMGSAGPDLVPAQRIAAPVGIPEVLTTVYESVPSDPWYVWCIDGGCSLTSNYLQDMFLGRLPVGTPEQAAAVVDKLIKYDDVQPDQTWRRKIMLSSDDQYSTQSFFGSGGGPAYCIKSDEAAFFTLNDVTRGELESIGGYPASDIDMFTLADYLTSVPTFDDPSFGTCRVDWRATQDYCHLNVMPQMMQHLNEGRVWWNFEGHANPYVLTHEDLYKNFATLDDLALFNNVDKPFLFSAFSCHPNAFGVVTEGSAIGPSLGEEMVTLPGKGAIASWASSGYELLPGDYFNHLTQQFARALFIDPPRDPYLGAGGSRVVLGESVALTLYRNVLLKSGWEADVGISYQLLGDPMTRITTGAPQSVVSANGLPVTNGDPVRLRTVGDTLRLEADLVSNVRLASIALDQTLAGSTITLPPSSYTLTPALTDSGAASHGGRRFHLTYRASLTPDNYTFTFRTTDRYGVAGRFDAVFPFQTVLRADGAPLGEGETAGSNSLLTLTVLSPSPLTLPSGLAVLLNNAPVPFGFAPANGDTTNREWTLTLPHGDFSAGDYRVEITALGGATSAHGFVVDAEGDKVSLRNTLAFPNPFDDVRGTSFSFRLVSPTPAEVQIRVYTVTGRLIYKRTEHAVPPGYQQLPWDGTDAEGQPIANGLYLVRVVASNGSSSDTFEGRLIKLRRPRRAAEQSSSNSP